MTNLNIAITGQGARTAHPAIARISYILLIVLVINVLGSMAALASGRAACPQSISRQLQTCAGNGGYLTVEMDESYLAEYGSCNVEAYLSSGGCYINVGMANACIPKDAEWTIATILIRDVTGNLNSVWAVRAVDGVVDLLESDF